MTNVAVLKVNKQATFVVILLRCIAARNRTGHLRTLHSTERHQTITPDSCSGGRQHQQHHHHCHLAIIKQFAISHVCSKWQSIALSFPCLWNYFCFWFGSDDSDSQRTPTLQLAEMWLSRSEGTLITMDVEVDCLPARGSLINSLISGYKGSDG
jgi:hypothetical protein